LDHHHDQDFLREQQEYLKIPKNKLIENNDYFVDDLPLFVHMGYEFQ
jgi:hypothetical protein